jgi:hypothetical protein
MKKYREIIGTSLIYLGSTGIVVGVGMMMYGVYLQVKSKK